MCLRCCVSEYLITRSRFWSHLSCCLSVKRSNWFKSLKTTAYLPVRSLTRTLFPCTCHRQYFVRASAHLWSFFRSNHVVERKEKHRRQLIHLINENALLDCIISQVLHKRIKRLSCLNRRRNILTVLLFLHLAIIYFAPFHVSLRHVQTCQLQKQTDPAKPVWWGVWFQNRMEVRFVTAASRGFFFLSWQDQRLRRLQSQLRYKKKHSSGSQGTHPAALSRSEAWRFWQNLP